MPYIDNRVDTQGASIDDADDEDEDGELRQRTDRDYPVYPSLEERLDAIRKQTQRNTPPKAKRKEHTR